MNRIKIDCRVIFSESIFNNFIIIYMEGLEFQDYNFIFVIQVWLLSVVRRLNQRFRKNYKSRDFIITLIVLIEEFSIDESVDEEEVDLVGVDDGRNMFIRELDELS